MNKFNRIVSEILSGRVSVIIYIAMFVYLVPVASIGLVPALSWIEPSANIMLIGDNYTSVLAALGASIAAGTGAVTHKRMNDYRKKHDDLQASIKSLHEKIDRMNGRD
jgi:hypothetical protein